MSAIVSDGAGLAMDGGMDGGEMDGGEVLRGVAVTHAYVASVLPLTRAAVAV
jgi:hypothetical protein